MSLLTLTATARVCQNCAKVLATQGSRLQASGISTSPQNFKDEDETDPLKNNPYFDKYSKKISELQKNSPEDLIRRLATFNTKKVVDNQKEAPLERIPSTTSQTKKKTLNELIKEDLLKDKSKQEIIEIWLKYYMEVKNAISIVIPKEVYDTILRTSSKYPTFLLPLPREHGFEYFVSQVSCNEFHFTPLINYQTYKENAPECLALTYFSELSDDKDIVLVKGEFNDDVLNVAEAMCLSNQLHKYYGQSDIQRQKLLERFTYAPTEFCHMDLIVELERMAV